MFLRKESNGYYYIYFKDCGSNKRKKKSTKVKNSNEATKIFTEFKKDYENKKSGIGIQSVTLNEFAVMMRAYKKNYTTANIALDYESELKRFDRFLESKVKVDEIRQIHLENYVTYLFKENYKAGTIKQKILKITVGLKYAKKNNMFYKDVEIITPVIKVPQIEKRFINIAELKLLLDNIKEKDLKDIVTVAFFTGMRLSELVNLKWEQVDFSENIIRLNNQTFLTKSRRIRVVPICDITLKVLKELYDKKTCDYVFTYRFKIWTKQNLSVKFNYAVEKAFGKDSKITFHTLRHSFASYLIINGVEIFTVSNLLGHSNILTTQIYSHLRNDHLQNAIKAFNKIEL